MPCPMDHWLASLCPIQPGPGGLSDLPYAVRAEQAVRLARTLARVRRQSRFYRQHLPPAVAAESVNPLVALAELPFTTPEHLLDWQAFLCVSLDAIERMVTLHSSGTTALPKRLAFSRADLAATRAFFRAGMSQLVQPGERVLALWPGASRPFGVSALLREALAEEGIEVVAGSPQPDAASLLGELMAHDPVAVVAAPSQLAVLAAVLADRSVAAHSALALRGVLSSAEPLDDNLVYSLATHNVLTLDHYGLTETGYGGGVECAARNGYHLRELDLLVEIVDPYSGATVPHGTEGEVVITTLNRDAMPLIRYRTGDVAALWSGPCRCGSPMQRLGPIRGRLVRQGTHFVVQRLAKGDFCERTVATAL